METPKLAWIARLSEWRRSSAPALRILGFVGLSLALLIAPLALVVIGRCLGAEYELGLRAAQLVYSWPVVTGVCIIVFLVSFRNPLSTLIRGLHRLKAAGLELESVQESLPQTARDPRKGEIKWDEWQLEILARLSPVDREVIVALGHVQREAFDRLFNNWWFEKVWGRIYGTQVFLVQWLITQYADSMMPIKEALTVFDEHVRRVTEVNPDRVEWFNTDEKRSVAFQQWLRFLFSAYLVELRQDGIVKTRLTEQFLAYMKEQSYTPHMRVF